MKRWIVIPSLESCELLQKRICNRACSFVADLIVFEDQLLERIHRRYKLKRDYIIVDTDYRKISYVAWNTNYIFKVENDGKAFNVIYWKYQNPQIKYDFQDQYRLGHLLFGNFTRRSLISDDNFRESICYILSRYKISHRDRFHRFCER